MLLSSKIDLSENAALKDAAIDFKASSYYEDSLKSMILVNKSELSSLLFTWCTFFSSGKKYFNKRNDQLFIKLNVRIKIIILKRYSDTFVFKV